MIRYGSGLHDQIEVYDDQEFYRQLDKMIRKKSKIKVSYPIYKMEGIPQIIEIITGLTSALILLLKLYEIYSKKKTKVIVRFKEGKI
ncbi:MAG: hypothetical protein ACETVR_04150, partial [Candidatus Bathyarchaeia archaeon]